MATYSTIIDILRDRAISHADEVTHIFLPDGETESGRLTYATLDQEARAIAAQLQTVTQPGDRALVVYPYPAGREFITAFFGCLYAGVIAVTDNPPRSGQSLAKLVKRAEATGAKVALTTQSLLTNVKEQLAKSPEVAPDLLKLNWIASDTLPLSLADDWQTVTIDGNTLAFLQHTSGSTGVPKGVMVTHENVLHNSQVIYEGFGHSENSIALMWQPLFHDMGLIGGVMQPIYAKFPMLLMSPVSLIQRPFRWLEAITKYRVTTSGGPNFAYDLLWRQATPEKLANLDLSNWDVAFSGAEPVLVETLEKFAEVFAGCGFHKEAFYPCYGMAESTLFISGVNKSDYPTIKYVDGEALQSHQVVSVHPDQPGARGVVSCGHTWLGDQIVIVDEKTLQPLPADQVGEIMVKGRGLGIGYWQKPAETAHTFTNTINGDGPFLRTGDLGFMQDGELYITGRIKDMMILWGRNHYPQNIELTVQKAHPALRPNAGAAFSITIDGEERLAIAQEVERTYLNKLDISEVIGAILQAIALQHLAEVEVIILLKTGSIPKTTSGKIQRSLCKTKYLENSLDAVYQWQQTPDSKTRLTDLLNMTGASI